MKTRATAKAKSPVHPPRVQFSAIAVAVLILSAGASPSARAQFYSVSGSVYSYPTDLFPIDVNTALLDLTGNVLGIGNGAAGSFSALAGALLTADALQIADGGTGTGDVIVTGPGTLVNLVGTGQINRLSVGNWGTASLTVSAGAVIDAAGNAAGCATANSFCNNFVGNAAGSNASFTVTDAGSEVRTLRQFIVGGTSVFTQAIDGFDFGTPGGTTTAAVNVLNGGVLRTQTATIGSVFAGQPSATGTEQSFATVLVSGVGSRWVVGVNTVDNTAAGMSIGNGVNAHGTFTVQAGGQLSIDGTGGPGPNDYINIGVNGGQGALTITGVGSSVVMTGVNPVLNIGRSGVGGQGSFSVLAGATASTLYSTVGRDSASGSLLIDGAGSQLSQVGVGTANASNTGGVAFANIGRDGGSGTATVSNGGQWLIGDGGQDSRPGNGSPGLIVGRGVGGVGTLTITGAGAVVQVVSSSLGLAPGTPDNFNPFVGIGYDNAGTASGSLLVSNGGKLLLSGNAVSTATDARVTSLQIGGHSAVAGTGTATVTGLGSEIVLSGYDRLVTVGRGVGGNGTLNVLDQGRVASTSFLIGDAATGLLNIDNSTVALTGFRTDNSNVGAGMTVGRGVGGSGTLTMTQGASLTFDNDTLDEGLAIGGDQFVAGGTGSASLAGGSSIAFTGAASGGMTIGYSGSGSMTLANASTVSLGDTRSLTLAGLVGGVGNLSVSSGSTLSGGVANIGGNSDSSAGGIGTVSVDGPGSSLQLGGANGFLGVGRGGVGSLTVTNQAQVAAIVLNVGRAAGGNGTMNVSGGIVALAGQQTTGNLPGAALSIGNLGGTGTANFSGGSQVTIANAGSSGASLNVGGTPINALGTGTLNVDASQVTLSAAPGQATVRIGHDGSGSATFSNGSSLDVGDGQVVIAGTASASGRLTLSSGSSVTASYIGVASTAQGNTGGAAVFRIDGSTVNAATVEIGATGTLMGNEGTINGNVIDRGVLSPGDSPGRVVINGGIGFDTGSSLLLDVELDNGVYNVDHLTLTAGSSFSFGSVAVTFRFLGDTDPNAFAASGLFDLDSFLQSRSASGVDTGLQTVFAPGTTWNTLFADASFSATSDAYDVTSLALDRNGSGDFSVTAVPVPEPKAWALWLAGLGVLSWVGHIGRRRAS